MVDFAKLLALDRLIVRKDELRCTQCGQAEPVHPGDGTPASTFITALKLAAERHSYCMTKPQMECDHAWDEDGNGAKCKYCKVAFYIATH